MRSDAGARSLDTMTTATLAAIGALTVILTAAVRIPHALAEFLRAWLPVLTAARELTAALRDRASKDER